jgi:hypothetical protein
MMQENTKLKLCRNASKISKQKTINKCKNDPEAFAYFMNCVRQKEENSDSGIN